MPDGFEFAPKLPGKRPAHRSPSSTGACGASATGSGRCAISLKSERDEGILELLLGSLDPSLRLAFDLEHPSWDGIEPRLAEAGAVRVGDLGHPAPFRYLRCASRRTRRSPPPWPRRQEPVYVYFRHDDEPTAPAHAERLRELLRAR